MTGGILSAHWTSQTSHKLAVRTPQQGSDFTDNLSLIYKIKYAVHVEIPTHAPHQNLAVPYFLPYELLISSHTAAVTSAVFALPPRSAVTTPFSQTRSTASNNLVLASFSPIHASISALVQNVATGLEIPFPVMSNAEPWMGSNMLGFWRVGSRFDVGAIPMDPASAAARSERMSAC